MATSHEKQAFLDTYDREHQTTMKVLRAYPMEELELRPHPTSRTARELAWTFVLERGLGEMVFNDEFPEKSTGRIPEPPADWLRLLAALEESTDRFRQLVASTPPEELDRKVHFLTAPKTIGEITRMAMLWFLLHDEIHHRGQFSVYLRMAGGQVPSIYGPSGDEPWM